MVFLEPRFEVTLFGGGQDALEINLDHKVVGARAK